MVDILLDLKGVYKNARYYRQRIWRRLPLVRRGKLGIEMTYLPGENSLGTLRDYGKALSSPLPGSWLMPEEKPVLNRRVH